MAGKRITNKQISEAITLREAGYTLTAIAQRLEVSVSSLQRAFKRHTVKPGALHAAAIEKAREDLLAHVTSTDQIKIEAAKLVLDDLAHSNLIREKAAITVESLKASDTAEAALTMRGLVAYSTLLRNTTDVIRRGMGLNRPSLFDDIEELPELIIHEMTADEIQKVQEEAEKLMM